MSVRQHVRTHAITSVDPSGSDIARGNTAASIFSRNEVTLIRSSIGSLAEDTNASDRKRRNFVALKRRHFAGDKLKLQDENIEVANEIIEDSGDEYNSTSLTALPRNIQRKKDLPNYITETKNMNKTLEIEKSHTGLMAPPSKPPMSNQEGVANSKHKYLGQITSATTTNKVMSKCMPSATRKPLSSVGFGGMNVEPRVRNDLERKGEKKNARPSNHDKQDKSSRKSSDSYRSDGSRTLDDECKRSQTAVDSSTRKKTTRYGENKIFSL